MEIEKEIIAEVEFKCGICEFQQDTKRVFPKKGRGVFKMLKVILNFNSTPRKKS